MRYQQLSFIFHQAPPCCEHVCGNLFNPLPDMPILGSSNSATNKDDVKNIDKWG